MNLVRRRLRELDAEMHASYMDEVHEWLARPAKDRGEPPADRTRLINDITIEMTARWLARGDGTGGVDADELTEWLRSLSKYRQGGGTDAARWLGLWSTQPWRYQRVDSHIDLLVRRPVITVCGGIQPQFLPLLGREGDGMRPRWLPHMSLTTELDPRAWLTPGWDEAVTALYGDRNDRAWTMPPRSLALWRSAQKNWKGMQRGSESPSVTAALAKADEQAARIALVIAESLNPGAGGEIPAKAVTAAIAITDYTLDVWRALPGGETLALSRRDAELGEAVDKLAEWLERHGGKASTRDILLAHVAGIRTAGKLAEVLAEYEATYPGSVREETPEERQGKRGPAGTYVFAPRRGHTQSPPEQSCGYWVKLLTATVSLIGAQKTRRATVQVAASPPPLEKLSPLATVILATVIWQQFPSQVVAATRTMRPRSPSSRNGRSHAPAAARRKTPPSTR